MPASAMPPVHDVSRTLRLGAPLARARGVVILLHGRGSSAEDIAGLVRAIPPGLVAELACLAPRAANHSWYPQRFLAPPERNEPWLSDALGVVDRLVREALTAGVPAERIALAGFSQGACLALEYAARHPRRHAFVAGLSGALIGPTDLVRPGVDLGQTPVLLECAELDAHIPREHVEHSASVLAAFNAEVTRRLHPGSAHTVFPSEIAWLETQSTRAFGRA